VSSYYLITRRTANRLEEQRWHFVFLEIGISPTLYLDHWGRYSRVSTTARTWYPCTHPTDERRIQLYDRIPQRRFPKGMELAEIPGIPADVEAEVRQRFLGDLKVRLWDRG
jgi:hypothetical protein